MTLGKSRRSPALWLFHALLPLVFLLGASTAHAQAAGPFPMQANDCINSTNPNGGSTVIWYVNVATGGDYFSGPGYVHTGQTPSEPLKTLGFTSQWANPGDLICVAGGTYPAFTAYKSGAQYIPGTTKPGWIKYEAMPNQNVVIDATGSWEGIAVGANWVQISGFEVKGDSASLNLTTALTDPGTPQYNGGCIGVGNGAAPYPVHVNIFNNYVHACPGGGIATDEADYVNISGNLIQDNAWFGSEGGSAVSNLYDYDSNPSDKTTPYKMIIANNVISNNYEQVPWVAAINSAKKITDGEGIIIDSNLNEDYVPSVGLPPYTGNTLVANNVIFSNGSSAIEVLESSNVDVLNNSTYGNRLSFKTANNTWDPNPTYVNSGELLLYDTINVRVLNNIFEATGLESPVAYIQDAKYCQTTYIPNTLCGAGTWFDYNLYYGGYANQSPTNAGYDVHSDYSYPYYVNTTAGPDSLNLQIQTRETSTIISRGTGWLAPSTDILGNPRVVSSSYTVPLGAYTYQ